FKTNQFIYISSLIIFLIIAVPNLVNLLSPDSIARNRWVGIITPASINVINESRRTFSGPQILNRLINNKIVYAGKTVVLNYLDLVNPLPLFLNGSTNYQFNPPNTPLIFIIFAPFFYYGLYQLIRQSFRSKNMLLLLILFVLTLFPAAITVGDFPSIRATVALPFYFIIIALGIYSLKISRSKIFTSFIIVIALFELASYWKSYLQYNRNYSQTWQYGYQPAVEFVKNNYSNYHQIVFTKKYGEPHEFILFYWPWDPQKYQSDPHFSWNFHADWYWIDSFDKFKFANDWDIPKLKFTAGTLLVTSPGNYPTNNSHLLKTINFLNGSPAFDIVSYE
ncbi:MAG TPA: hypothetical protein VF828_00125, partial [Patescibacteria group bacterium]